MRNLKNACSRGLMMAGVGGVSAVVGAAAAVLVISAFSPTRMLSSLLPHQETHFRVDLPAVVDRLRRLNRLETADLHVQKIVEGSTRVSPVPGWLYGDHLTLAAEGTVTAGIDLSHLARSDVRLSGNRLFVHLPSARILSITLDPRTHVAERNGGVFGGGNQDLESMARSEAESQIRAAAIDDHLLNDADKNARTDVEGLLRLCGAGSVTFN